MEDVKKMKGAKLKFLNSFHIKSDHIHEMRRHRHAIYEMFCFVSGRGLIESDYGTYRLSIGDLIIFPPFTFHKEKSDNVFKEEAYFIRFEVLNDFEMTKPYYFNDDMDIFLPLFKQIHRLSQLDSLEAKEMIDKYLDILWLHVVNETKLLHLDRIKQDISKVKAYIDQNYMKSITIEKLLKQFPQSRATLIRQFVKKYNISPIKYCNRLRLLEASRMLIGTEYSINKIARDVGFNDPLYFSKQFKKMTNQTPKEYRNDNNIH